MTDRVRAILASLTPEERQQLLNALAIEHFSAGEREVRVEDHEGILYGFLTTRTKIGSPATWPAPRSWVVELCRSWSNLMIEPKGLSPPVCPLPAMYA